MLRRQIFGLRIHGLQLNYTPYCEYQQNREGTYNIVNNCTVSSKKKKNCTAII